MSKKKAIHGVSSEDGGSTDVIKESNWSASLPPVQPFKSFKTIHDEAHQFRVGDLVTIAAGYRRTAAGPASELDRYIGVVVEVYQDREYVVTWTTHPVRSMCNTTGLFNGDYLLPLESYMQ
tara:strand:+ start:569 stop:931 length:363 start_codon:yes stop_codon:yes gene_type:complete